ncbi:MAG: hypothetical protein C6I01_03505 [Epsilonproteobacteria bacterium]|nr:hypothetical protein [Campylobacterota bacterium]
MEGSFGVFLISAPFASHLSFFRLDPVTLTSSFVIVTRLSPIYVENLGKIIFKFPKKSYNSYKNFLKEGYNG